jgi:hypothetical protein
MSEKKTRTIHKKNISELDLAGKLHCVSVPDGRIIVRDPDSFNFLLVGNCMAYIQFVLQAVVRQSKALGTDVTLSIPVSGHCWTVWHNTPALYRFSEPAVGRIVIWNNPGTTNGHTGLITDIWSKTSWSALEGNTSASSTSIVRNGGQVAYKKRTTAGTSTMKILGYIDPWGQIR